MTPGDAKRYLGGLLTTVGGRAAGRMLLDEILQRARPLLAALDGARAPSRVGDAWTKGGVIVAMVVSRAGVEVAGASVDGAAGELLDGIDFGAPRAMAKLVKRVPLVQRLRIPTATMRALVG